ncbi:MAG: ABC transporter ATP-binding protein [Fervidicoccaceae archaeon]
MIRLRIEGDIGWSRSRPVLERVKLAFSSGELNCVLGPNGSGKTTLLLTLGGALKPLSGRVELSPPRAEAVYVPAYPPDFSGLSVGVVLSYYVSGCRGILPGREREEFERALELLERLGGEIEPERGADELSTGERTKLMLAGALASRARILLLDEPTSHLDVRARLELFSLLREARREKLVIASMHEVNEASLYCDSATLLSGGEALQGPVREILRTENLTRAYRVEFEEILSGRFRFFVPLRPLGVGRSA